jgi:hypothetical protein
MAGDCGRRGQPSDDSAPGHHPAGRNTSTPSTLGRGFLLALAGAFARTHLVFAAPEVSTRTTACAYSGNRAPHSAAKVRPLVLTEHDERGRRRLGFWGRTMRATLSAVSVEKVSLLDDFMLPGGAVAASRNTPEGPPRNSMIGISKSWKFRLEFLSFGRIGFIPRAPVWPQGSTEQSRMLRQHNESAQVKKSVHTTTTT